MRWNSLGVKSQSLFYAQCDVDRLNIYCYTFVDHKKDGLENQKMVFKGKESIRKSTAGWAVTSGRTAQPHGRRYPVLKSHT